ncbi:MAG: imidazole glycerol phosphate synthase subunit HisH [Ignavibacteria bacterium]|nr:imidazole glycerol phosphate synthase subunit HisH [Ignavibacteria bacterium]
MIDIIDYGMGNLGSIFSMFKKIGVESKITSALAEIQKANKIVLPGVGAFDTAMKRINESGLRKMLEIRVLNDKIPILGICLGMQLFTDSSEEGEVQGLGWIPAKTKRFNNSEKRNLKIPHMGWNTVDKSNISFITEGLPEDARFYFVHSFYVKVVKEENSIMKTNYIVDFDSAIQKNNIFGVQFHPEKSHKFGMKMLEKFARL